MELRARSISLADDADGDAVALEHLLIALRAYKRGDFSVRMPLDLTGRAGEVAEAFNDAIDRNEALLQQSQSLTRELRVQQEELRQSNEQLALTYKYKSQFLANMSHELRTPLNSLLILSKMLSDNVTGNLLPKQVEFLRTIHAAGADLLVLINDILDLSKIESGTVTVDVSEVAFADLRDYVEQAFGHVAADKGLTLSVELDPNLPPSIHTDAQRLQQVLKNLMSNAIKFTERGTVSLRPRVVKGGWGREHEILNRAATVIAFDVRDTGIGIADDKQRIIFEAFQQADGTTSRKYGGTGLGLSISRELAHLLGGEVRVASALGYGSIFTLYLPVAYVVRGPQPVPLEVVEPPRAEHEPVAEPSRRWARIDDRDHVQKGDRVVLIVEDDEAFARSLLDRARARGWRAVVAGDAAHALELLHDVTPSAIWLDLELPDADGRVLLDQLKRDPATRHVPVQIVSGSETAARDALLLGARGYLTKPLSPEQIDAVLDAMRWFLDEPSRAVLVVAGDAAVRQELNALVGGKDVACTIALGADEALAALAVQRFACVVVDVGLADRGAFALFERARRVDNAIGVPFVAYAPSSWASEPDRRAALATELLLREARSRAELVDQAALYLHRDLETLDERQRAEHEPLQRAGVLAGTTVLVIDDDVRNIFAVTSALEREEARVLHAEGGAEGLALLERSTGIDVVLTDVMMPEVDGYEVMRRIRAQPRFAKLPIVALTAKAMQIDRDNCIAAGASDYIAKPVDVGRLASIIRVVIGPARERA